MDPSSCTAIRCSSIDFKYPPPHDPPSIRWICYHKISTEASLAPRSKVQVTLKSAFQPVCCDGVVGSGVAMDACGVCGGQGKGCRLYEGIFMEPILPRGHQPVTTVPKGAMSLNISELRFSNNFLGTVAGGRPCMWRLEGDVSSKRTI